MNKEKEVIPTSEELKPLVGNAEDEVKKSLDKINSKNLDWTVHVDSLQKLRRAVLYHSQILHTNKNLLKLCVVAVLDAVDNLRSLVSRNAIACASDMFSSLGKSLDGELDLMVPKLLKKYAESNKFFEEDLDRTIMRMVPSVSGSKLLPVLLTCCSNKHVQVRVKATNALARTVATVLGAKVLRMKEFQKLLQVLAALAGDSNVDIRTRVRQTVFAIYNYGSDSDFEKMLQQKVTPSEARSLKEAVEKMKKEMTVANGGSPNRSAEASPAPSPGPSASPSQIAKPPKTSKVGGTAPAKTQREAVQLTPKKKEFEAAASSPQQGTEYLFRAPSKALVVVGGDMEENIKVAVRIRPLDPQDKIPRENWTTVEPNAVVSVDPKHKNVTYAYDFVYGKQVQDTNIIYEQVGSPIVRSVMQGYNGTMFAYGQTASGKTHTMMGTDENPGIIPIAIYDVFEYIKNSPQREFLLRVSYMEIYNEIINDLLNTEGTNLNIREDKKKGIYIESLKEEIVVSPEHVLHVISSGEAQRHVASTDYNLISSRSHTIFRLIIESNNIGDVEGRSVTVSALTLIDLAGSEKVVSTSAMRRREGAYINKSLLTLGTIISKLSERKKGENIGYLPYRDSKLTRVLEPSLSGNARIAIIATVNPGFLNFEESNNTLKFASRAKKVANRAVIGQDSEKVLIMKYKKQIEELKEKLKVAQEAEEKLKEIEDSQLASENQLVKELRDELQEQENLRVSLEQKIKQLTKLILVSTSMTNLTGKRERARTGIPVEAIRNLRGGGGEKLTNVRRSIDLDEMEALSSSPVAEESALRNLGGSEALQRVNTALRIKADSLQQQCEWREKQMAKLQKDISDQDSKIESLLAGHLTGSLKTELEQFKMKLKRQYEEQIESLKEVIQRQHAELEVHRADNKSLQEKLAKGKT